MDDKQYRAALLQLAGRGSELSAKKRATRQRIFDSTTELIQSQGLRRTSMEQIAELAGVSRGTLYTYAKNKQDLVIQALAEEQLANLRPVFSNDSRQRLEGMVTASVASFEHQPLLGLLVKGDADLLRSLEDHPDVKGAFPVNDHDLLVEAIQEVRGGAPVEQARRDAAILQTISAVGPYLVDAAPTYGLEPAELASRLAKLLVEGLIARDS